MQPIFVQSAIGLLDNIILIRRSCEELGDLMYWRLFSLQSGHMKSKFNSRCYDKVPWN